ncbi:MAG: type III-B CRISPR module-associated protein Cmr5 [Bradymonadaceae bacterium]
MKVRLESLAGMIRHYGLGQTAVGLLARDRGDDLYDELCRWLCHEEKSLFEGRRDLLEALTLCERAEYMTAQSVALNRIQSRIEALQK